MNKIVSASACLRLLTMASGLAALSWEVVWQIKSTLALGVSAKGTAVTLAVTMGGMCLGSLIAGCALKNKPRARPLRLYAGLECLIALSGLFLIPAFRAIEKFDTRAYTALPGNGALIDVLGIVAILGLPAICMGATLPPLGLAARQLRTPLAVLYGLNTLGAAGGVLLAAFFLIPVFGITHVIWIIAAANLTVGFFAAVLDHTYTPQTTAETADRPPPAAQTGMREALAIVFVTGFATFSLEIAWFRSLTAAFMSTTEAFAIMLACVLISLSTGAGFVPPLKARKIPLGVLLGWAGITILLATPVIERFDFFTYTVATFPFVIFAQWFFMTLYVIGAPIILLGTALPWILDDQSTTSRWGVLYSLNALAGVIGALSAGWIFLPVMGFSRTACLSGVMVAGAGVFAAPRQKRVMIGALAAAALLTAVMFESGVGRTRAQGTWSIYDSAKAPRILEAYEGPDSTASAVEYEGGKRALMIDGFSTAVQHDKTMTEHYMAWMGHLPMLLAADPQKALVICFGTGQTANAVRRENPKSLDIVDINANVLKLAHNFYANDKVLDDPRVRITVMDGRAYIRRTDKLYDVITLEPMPPTFAGVNALYSQEFYQAARQKLRQGGVIAQWLPFHLLDPHYSASIARTFQSVFPNALLWIDPSSGTGILLGTADDDRKLGAAWPGFARTALKRDMSEAQMRKAVLLNREALLRYGSYGEIISDDNQLLAYGKASRLLRAPEDCNRKNRALLDRAITTGDGKRGVNP